MLSRRVILAVFAAASLGSGVLGATGCQLERMFPEKVGAGAARLSVRNAVKLISIIGPTGIGKSTLTTSILTKLVDDLGETRQPHVVPLVYVTAPANGEHSMSWKTLFRRIMIAAGTPHLSLHRPVEVLDGELHAVRSGRTSLAHLREELGACRT